MAAASVAIIIFSVVFYVNHHGKKSNETATIRSSEINKDSISPDDNITVPKSNLDDDADNTYDERQGNSAAGPSLKKYITITGPQGQPVKISSKAATLIVASGDQNPAEPVWNAKVKKWKDIMLANTLAPTTANFLDIVELTHVLRVGNP